MGYTIELLYASKLISKKKQLRNFTFLTLQQVKVDNFLVSRIFLFSPRDKKRAILSTGSVKNG